MFSTPLRRMLDTMGVYSSIFHFAIVSLRCHMGACSFFVFRKWFSLFRNPLKWLCGCHRLNKRQKFFTQLVHWREQDLTSCNLANKVCEISYRVATVHCVIMFTQWRWNVTQWKTRERERSVASRPIRINSKLVWSWNKWIHLSQGMWAVVFKRQDNGRRQCHVSLFPAIMTTRTDIGPMG